MLLPLVALLLIGSVIIIVCWIVVLSEKRIEPCDDTEQMNDEQSDSEQETMSFDIPITMLARLEAISRKTKIPVDVLIVWAHVRYYEAHRPRKPSSGNE